MKQNNAFVLAGLLIAIAFSALNTVAQTQGKNVSHAVTIFGTAKYPAEFKHFDYVNRDAPKGGEIRREVLGTFDTLNPFSGKGVAGFGIYRYTFDSLMELSLDEAYTSYGLLASSIEIGPDIEWVAFNMNPDARFHNNQPVTAHDVAFTFKLLTRYGDISFRNYYREVESVEARSSSRVVFKARKSGIKELPAILSEMIVLPRSQWQGREQDFNKSTMIPLTGSGPYKVSNTKAGKQLTLTRDDQYWAKNHPVNRGRFNFKSMTFDYYRDESAALQAFNAGHYDLRYEFDIQAWEYGYNKKEVDSGTIKKLEVPLLGYFDQYYFFFNTRNPFLQDILVRQAIDKAFDFTRVNYTLLHNSFTETRSLFSGQPFASPDLPGHDEIALLKPFEESLPEHFFTPLSDLKSNRNTRQRLSESLELLKEAGWTLSRGVLRNQQGQPMKLKLLMQDDERKKIAITFKKALSPLGIEIAIQTVDSSQYLSRLRKHDYDMLLEVLVALVSPGNEQRTYWSSDSSNESEGYNYSGVNDPAIDYLIEKLVQAENEASMISVARALDRLLVTRFYFTKGWYKPTFRIVYRNPHLRRPVHGELYGSDLDAWWYQPEDEHENASAHHKKPPAE
ncbi:extracellular solute-binding protein [Endozoicomonas arenosclerae]|uniref:extracellular solute-binding protein n=1 Tax=Endozoicomonas arenosclerae TaxID=1633495 RepID=UPI0007836F7B|nr:extracellular solute-binding protein [Endozoicomonas arenosclerae]